ncbi:MAG TPA: pyruvate kinase [Phycisphaerae bacterium]|nr:pyruvate kinase [Phycisphaerae bacterium]
MPIKTKIIATLGPACCDASTMTRLVEAGLDVFRMNFSHGTLDEHARCLKNVRAVSKRLAVPLAAMADLCGPKIRVGKVEAEGVILHTDDELVIQREPVEGTRQGISTTLPELMDAVHKGDRISFDDGRIEVEVVNARRRDRIVCRVTAGGTLRSSKGVNLPDTELSLPALTEKDRADAEWIVRQDFDYVALSFVQRAHDIAQLRELLDAGGSTAQIVAKIEKPQAVRNIESIIDAADAVLVARGDLGVELALPEVPIAQKRLVRLCEQAGKCCIIATQMLESMIEQPMPTRAEVSDVANAVFDGADAVMLSGETAVGKHPVQAVGTMNAIVGRAEEYLAEGPCQHPSDMGLSGTEAAIAQAVHSIIHAERVRAVVAFTISGATARMLAKMRLEVPILALTPDRRVMQQACLFYGVDAELAKTPAHTREVLSRAARRIRALGWAKKGEKIVVVSGRPLGKPGSTNTIVVHTL